jgi:Zn-dependent alcohol dehydrogenase
MMRTYKAMQVSEPGKLKIVELPVSEPGPGQVRLRVEACGVLSFRHSNSRRTVSGPDSAASAGT